MTLPIGCGVPMRALNMNGTMRTEPAASLASMQQPPAAQPVTMQASDQGQPLDQIRAILGALVQGFSGLLAGTQSPSIQSFGQPVPASADVRQPASGYGDNNNVDRMLSQLAGNDPQSLSLLNTLHNLAPESPESQQVSAQLAAHLQSQGRPAAQIQQIFWLAEIRQLNRMQAALGQLGGNMDPASPELQGLMARQSALASKRDSLAGQVRLSQLSGDNTAIQQALAQHFQAEPGSGLEMQLEGLLVQQFQALGYSAADAQQIVKLSRLSKLDNLSGALYAELAKMPPESPESQQLMQRLNALEAMRAQLRQS